MTPGHDGRARRRALNLDVVIVEANALAGQLVNARGGYRAAVNPEIAPADVVHQDEHHVGLPLLRHVVPPGGSGAYESRLEASAEVASMIRMRIIRGAYIFAAVC